MRKQRSKEAPTSPQGLGSYLLPMLLSAAVGAGVTWLIMSQRSASVERPTSFITPSAQNQKASAPAADVTGLSAADAAVVRGNQAYDHQQWADAVREYQDALAFLVISIGKRDRKAA